MKKFCISHKRVNQNKDLHQKENIGPSHNLREMIRNIRSKTFENTDSQNGSDFTKKMTDFVIDKTEEAQNDPDSKNEATLNFEENEQNHQFIEGGKHYEEESNKNKQTEEIVSQCL